MTDISEVHASVTISVSFGSSAPLRSIMQRSVPLSRELRSFLQPHHLKLCERFDQFHLSGHDRIEAILGRTRDAYVQQRITEVACALQFMDVTGLQPTSDEIYGGETYSKEQRLPGQDHATTWKDPVRQGIVMLDEPYGYVDQLFGNRNAWAESHGFSVRRLNWVGTYRPGHGTVCDLVSPAGQGALVDRIVALLEPLEHQ
jgi:hypothetical protein